MATHNHPTLGQEGWGLCGVDQSGHLEVIVSPVFLLGQLLEGQRTVIVTKGRFDGGTHCLCDQRVVVPGDENDRGDVHPASLSGTPAASTSAMTSATRREPRTSWVLSIRQPFAMPRA